MEVKDYAEEVAFDAVHQKLTDLSSIIPGLSVNLTYVCLRQNRLTCFDELPALPALEHLDLYDNLITGISDLTRFPCLKILDLSFNCIESLDSIEGAFELTELYISNNYITCLKPLSSCTNLRKLELGHNKLTSLESLPVKSLQALAELWLGCNQLDGVCELSFPNLKTICLSSNRLTSVDGIQNCPSITECLVDNNQLQDILSLNQCKDLEVVDISHNKVTKIDPIVKHQLTDFWISHNPQLDVIPELLKLEHKSKVDSLAVQGCKAPSQDTLVKMLRGMFPNLRTLNGDPLRQ